MGATAFCQQSGYVVAVVSKRTFATGIANEWAVFWKKIKSD